jgi:hypothetical protein
MEHEGFLPSTTGPIVAKATLVDDFTSELVQEDVQEQLKRLYAVATTPNGVNSTQLPLSFGEEVLNANHSNGSLQHLFHLKRPTSHLMEHHARHVHRLMAHGTSVDNREEAAERARIHQRRRLQAVPQDPPTNLTQLYSVLVPYLNLSGYDATRIAQECTPTTNHPLDYAVALSDFCNPGHAKFDNDKSVVECKLLNACRMHLKCGGNLLCAQNVKSEIEANAAAQARALQTKQIGFFRIFFQSAIQSNNDMLVVSKQVNDALNDIVASSDSELAELRARKDLINNVSKTNDQLSSLINASGQLLIQVSMLADQDFTQLTNRFLDLLAEFDTLTTLTETIQNQLKNKVNNLATESQIIQVQLLSLLQVSSLTLSNFQVLQSLISEVQFRHQSRRILIKNAQLGVIYASRAGAVPLITDMGVAPASLLAHEVYRYIASFSFWRLRNATSVNSTIERTTWTFRCNIPYLAFDLTPRNSIFDPQHWVGPTNCQLSNTDGDMVSPTPCKCFVRELVQNTTDPRVYDFLLGDYVALQTPSEGYSFSYDTIDSTRFEATLFLNVTARPEDNGTVVDPDYVPGNFLAPGTFDQSGLYRVVSSRDMYSRTDFQDAIESLCLDAYIPNAADVMDARVGSAPVGETSTQHAQRRHNGVFIRAYAYGLDTYQAILDENPTNRNYCVANAALMSQWFNNVTTVSSHGKALPHWIYDSLLHMMASYETEIDKVRILMEGKLVAPVKTKSTRAKYTPGGSFSATTHTINFTAAALSSVTNTFTSYEDQAIFAYQSVDQTKVHRIFNPTYGTPVNVLFPGETSQPIPVLRAVARNIRWNVIPTHGNLVGYVSCFTHACPTEVGVMDPHTGLIFGVFEPDTNHSLFELGSNATDPNHNPWKGFQRYGYDIPEELSGYQRKSTPYYIMERTRNPVNSFNFDSDLDGPMFRRPSQSFRAIYNSFTHTQPFDPEATNVPASIYRTKLISESDFEEPDDFQCDPTLRTTANPSAFFCRSLDLFRMQVNETSKRIRYTPRQDWELEVTIRIPAGTLLSSVASLSTDQLACPSEVSFPTRQSDAVPVKIINYPDSGLTIDPTTHLLGGGRVQIMISSSGCPQDPVSKTSLGMPPSTVNISTLTYYQELTTSIVGCMGQTITVAVVNTSTNQVLRCASTRPYPAPISYGGLRGTAIEESSMVVDQTGGVLAALASRVQTSVQLLADTALPLLAQSLQGQVVDLSPIHSSKTALKYLMGNATQAILDSHLFTNQTVNQINHDIESATHLIGNTSFQEQFNETFDATLQVAADSVDKLRQLLPILSESINRTTLYFTNLAKLNLLFPGAGANLSFEAITDPALALLHGLGCQSALDDAAAIRAHQDDEYRHSLECSGIMCIRGPNVGGRGALLAIPATLGTLAGAILSSSITCPTKKGPGSDGGSGIRSPWIGMAIGYVLGNALTGFLELD